MSTQPPKIDSAEQSPLPIPDDVPASAPIFNDVERGYPKSELVDERGRKGSESSAVEKAGKKHGKGLTEGDHEVDDVPENNLLIVMPAIGLVLFLAALDMSIVSTALPTIAEKFNATPSEYSWVGTAYQLAMTLQTPLNGRVSDIVGRKPMLYAAILVFSVFSALCGAAKSMRWLIIARAFQGLGGGSILGLTNILVSDIVPLHKRGVYQGWIGGTWGIAAVLGPILGGLLTEKASWRWIFYINLPTCGIAFVLLLLTLNLNPTRKLTFKQLRATFDFVGMLFLMAGGSLLIVGFANAADYGFDAPSAYGIIVAGVVMFIAAVINFLFTKRNAIIPARMFKIRTTLFFLIGSFLHATAFLPANFLLPQMFQGVRGAGALESGIQLLPFAVIVAIGTIIAGQINSRLRIIRPVVWTGFGLGALGYGLFYGLFRYPFSVAEQSGIMVIGGLGIGLSLQVPMLILQAAMPLKEMAATTSAFILTRSLGGSIGLALFTAVLNTELRAKFKVIPGYGTDFEVPQSASGYQALHALPEGPTKTAVLSAFADSLGVCWIIAAGLLIFALLLTLWTRSYSLDRGQKLAADRKDSLPTDQSQGSTELSPATDASNTTNEEKQNEDQDAVDESIRKPTVAGGSRDTSRNRSRGGGRETPSSEKTIIDLPPTDSHQSDPVK